MGLCVLSCGERCDRPHTLFRLGEVRLVVWVEMHSDDLVPWKKVVAKLGIKKAFVLSRKKSRSCLR